MADKGFDIKVLVPTEDGFTISDKNLYDIPYFLMYNISNRSYQLAGKIKAIEYFKKDSFKENIIRFFQEEKIDYLVGNPKDLALEYLKPEQDEINIFLNELIDKIDQKKELK